MSEENITYGSSDNIGSLVERLRQAANEIDLIKDTFSRSNENLSKIRGMLDVDSLDNITIMIERFEEKVMEAEKQREEASQGVHKYSQELEKEKERLIKLWDAYKNQEEELSKMEEKVQTYEQKIQDTEMSKKQLEEDLTGRIQTLNQKIKDNEENIDQVENYKQKLDNFESINYKLEQEKNQLQDDLKSNEDTINHLQNQVNELKESEKYSEFKTKYEDISKQYEKERERLTKLYHLYEETEAECKKLKEQNKNWNDWFESNKTIFDKLFASGPPTSPVKKKVKQNENQANPKVEQTIQNTPTANKNLMNEDTDIKPSKSKRKILGFKK